VAEATVGFDCAPRRAARAVSEIAAMRRKRAYPLCIVVQRPRLRSRAMTRRRERSQPRPCSFSHVGGMLRGWWLWVLSCVVVASCVEATERVAVSSHDGRCSLCHLQDWSTARVPNHLDANISQDCVSCHLTSSWAPAPGFEHTLAFPLTLGHAQVACGSCHVRGFKPGATSDACISCHAPAARAVQDPIHAGLSDDCFACHRTDGFWPSHFVHAWPLKGKHALTSCRSCHSSAEGAAPDYERTASACSGCHMVDRQRADNLVGGHSDYPQTCDNCHGVESFLR